MSKRADRIMKMMNVKQAVSDIRQVERAKDTLRDLMIDIEYYNFDQAEKYDGDFGSAHAHGDLIWASTDKHHCIYLPMHDVDDRNEVDPFEYYGTEFVLRMAEKWLTRQFIILDAK